MNSIISICAICKLSTQDHTNIVFCTNCDQAYHFEHLQKWLAKHTRCPQCKHLFSFEFMSHMRPFKKRQAPTANTSKGNTSLNKSTRSPNYPQGMQRRGDTESKINIQAVLAAFGFFFVILFIFMIYIQFY